MTENEFEYWAFLSFSAQDNGASPPGAPEVGRLQWGDWLHDILKSFPIPADFVGHINARGETVPERIDAIFRDEELAEGAGLSAAARKALEQSRCLIVICSPRSAKSLHVNETVRYFKQLGRGNRILSIVIAGEPNASTAHQPGLFLDDECFVPAMRHPALPDGTLDTTRQERGYIFADARHGDDKREVLVKDLRDAETELERAKIQLIAGLIGVGFNNLWQREQKRRFAGFAEAQSQIQEAWQQARKAQKEAEETQKQVQVLQQEARVAEGKVAAAQQQLEIAHSQIRDAQNKVLEIQNLPQDIKSQIQAAQNRALAAENQTRAAQGEIQQLQNRVREAEQQLELARNQALEIQRQLEAARNQTAGAENRQLEALQQARSAQLQLEEVRNQARATQSKGLETQNLSADLQSQILLAQSQAQEFQKTAREAESRRDQFRDEARAAQAQLAEAHSQTQVAQNKIAAVESRARAAQKQIEETQQQSRAARRLMKVFAVLAALAVLAAGVVWSQRKKAGAETAMVFIAPVAVTNSITNQLDSEQIRQLLQNANSAGHSRDLDELAARILPEKISETLNLAAAILDGPQRGRFQKQLLDNWVKADAAAAFDWSRQLTNAESLHLALEKTVPAMASDNSTNALVAFDWLETQTNADAPVIGVWRNLLTADLFKSWAVKDLNAAASASGQLAEGATKELVEKIIYRQRIAKSPAVAAELLTNFPAGDFRQSAIIELGRHWGSNDAPAALAWAQALPAEIESSNAVGQVVGSWARNDFVAATNAVAALPEGNKKISAQLALTEPWAQRDAPSLATNALALPTGEVQARWLAAAARQWATSDFAGAAELLQSVGDVALRQNILEQAARDCDLFHRELATKSIVAMPAGDDQKAAIRGLVSSWGPADPEAALNWLVAFPETNSQFEQAQSVIKNWSQTEPAAAAKWLSRSPAETASEGLIGAFLEGAVGKYPEFAAQWTQSVADESKRQKFQIQVAGQWMKISPAAASNWINNLNLPEAAK